jgi:hypothetical protein
MMKDDDPILVSTPLVKVYVGVCNVLTPFVQLEANVPVEPFTPIVTAPELGVTTKTEGVVLDTDVTPPVEPGIVIVLPLTLTPAPENCKFV